MGDRSATRAVAAPLKARPNSSRREHVGVTNYHVDRSCWRHHIRCYTVKCINRMGPDGAADTTGA
eukprot:785421-Prymnesium_polylepis.1